MTGAPRPAVLALPTSTTLRMVVVAVALLVSALFVGTALHNALLGQAWDAAVRVCVGPSGLLSTTAEQLSCQAPAERRRAMVALLVAVLAVALAAMVVALAPVVVRRRRRLVPADPRFARAVQVVADLAATAGVRAPGVLIVPGTASDPFCVGRPGDYRIALPRKLALLGNPALFEALVGHEVAHLAHRDVALSWLARSLWYVLGPLLAVPILIALVRGEPALALDILWRAVVLIAVVLLVVRGLMRAREYDADLRAAQIFAAGHVLGAELSRHPAARRGWRTAVAWHPEPYRRRAVLADPTAAAQLTWLDGLTLGFLIALALPIVGGIASALFFGVPVAGFVAFVGAVVLGPLFGATVGVGLWRHALAARAVGRRRGTGPVALGVLAGGLLGQLVSLARVGLGAPQLLLFVPVALAGTTVLVGGLGELWVWGIGRTRRPAAVWVPAALLGAAAATAALWAAPQAQLLLEFGGWALLAAWLTTPGALVFPGVVAVLLAVAAGWAIRPRRDGSLPGWWGGPSVPAAVPGGGAVFAGLAAGMAGGVALAVYRAVAGAATSDVDKIQLVDAGVLGSGLVGVAVVVVLGLARGAAGAASGLLAGPVAALTVAAWFLVTVALAGGNPLPLTAHVLGGALACGFLVTICAAALTGALAVPPLRSTALVVAIALVMGAATAGTAMAARQSLVPGLSAVLPGYSEIEGAVVPTQPVPSVDPVVPREFYADVVARPLLDGRVASSSAFRDLQAERPPANVAATRIRAEILPLLRQMLDGAQSVRIDDPRTREVHSHAVAGAQLHVRGFEMLVEALDQDDQQLADQASALLADGNAEWQQWAAGVQEL